MRAERGLCAGEEAGGQELEARVCWVGRAGPLGSHEFQGEDESDVVQWRFIPGGSDAPSAPELAGHQSGLALAERTRRRWLSWALNPCSWPPK